MDTKWVVLFLVLTLWLPVNHCHRPCTDGMIVDFVLTNTKNSSTSWQTQVQVENKENKNSRWSVEINEIDRPTCECTETLRFTGTLAALPVRVVPDYDYIPSVGYYKMHGPGKNWEEARRTCVREGGHLAIINSEAEATVLQLMFARTTSQKPYALIGFHDHYVEGEYLTLYDEPISTTGFTRWGNGQPDNVGAGENCGSVLRFDGSLNDIDCGSTDWPFICEQEL